MSFASLGLPKTILSHLENHQIDQVYPIQQKAIPAILRRDDVLGIAPTGSGKTLSYVLPILTQLQKAPAPQNRAVPVLIVVPTRELAEQVKLVFHQFGKDLSTPIKTLAVYGGVSINPQMQALNKVNVLIATPGRLLELSQTNALSLDQVRLLVLDEADKLLNQGFEEEINAILEQLPKQRQNLLFSATLNPKVDAVQKMVLNNAQVIEVAKKEVELDQIEQYVYFIEPEEKGPLLRQIIAQRGMQQMLVFASSSKLCDRIQQKLERNGFDAITIHGKKSQMARRDALQSFKDGEFQVLIATDLLARGIDIKGLALVINYDLPRSPKDYVHRIGRTGRADQSGTAISLVSPDEEHHFSVIKKKLPAHARKVEELTIGD